MAPRSDRAAQPQRPRLSRVLVPTTIAIALACAHCTASTDGLEFVPDDEFNAGAAGSSAGNAGSAGKAASGSAGSTAGTGGKNVGGTAGQAGAGAGGQAGKGGSAGGQAGASGTSGAAGASGTAGKSGASGAAGKSGASGTAGAGGSGTAGSSSGSAGAAGTATAGTAGTGTAGTGTAGTAGSGTSGTAGTGTAGTGTAGSPGGEQCDNGVDDDQNGLVDCADTQGCAGSVCTPAPDSGWVGPLSLLDGDVDCGALDKVYSVHANPTAAPATCAACTCDPPTGMACSTNLHATMGQSCEFDPCGPLNLTAPVACASAAPLDAGCGSGGALESFGTATVSGGSCQPAPVAPPTLPPVTWGKQLTACKAQQLGGGCGGGVCAPAAPPGGLLCVAQAGDVACPTGYPTKHVYYEGVTDTRGCSACGCGGPSGGTCAPKITIYNDTVCAKTQLVFTAGYSCQIVPAVAGYFSARSYSYAPGPVTGASCPASGGAPLGSVAESGAVTFCCGG